MIDLLRTLGTFVRVVETGSFSAVARENDTTHSAVTRLISQLEAHFGVRLFHRSTRRLTLTEDGEDLLAQARPLLEAAADLEESVHRTGSALAGRIRLGLPVGAATLLVPRLTPLLQRYPGLAIDLVVRDTFENLIEERLDVALRLGSPGDGAVVSRSVGSFGFATVAASSYLARSGAPAVPADLTGHACLVHDIGSDSAHWRYTGPDGAIDIAVTGPLRANNSEIVRQAVLAGFGIARLSEAMVMDDIRSGRLYRLLADFPSDRRQAFLVYPSRRHLAARTRLMIDFLVERLVELDHRLADARIWGENETVWLV
jgi:DNA-binding transcriptional LysR family regulator